jgi:peptidoglycan/LPS O-acetylase OafA/YrhL
MIVLNHLLELNVTKGEVLSSLTYTSNFYWYFQKVWPAASPHFWSLAVEEQFYLIWPLLMLFLPRKFLFTGIIGFIAIGLTSQLLITDFEFGYLPTYTCFDCFGMGGLLAYLLVYKPDFLPKFYKMVIALSVIAIVLLLVDWYYYTLSFIRFIHAILTLCLITHLLITKKSFLSNFLSNNVLVSIGKVSYGIYLYHVLYMYIGLKLWYRYAPHFIAVIERKYQAWIFLVVNYVVLYFICLLSWRLVEKPILSLKRKFEYQES